MTLLQVVDLHAQVAGKHVLDGVELTIGSGEVHVLLGANGSGKSSLTSILLGHAQYVVEQGKIVFDGQDLLPIHVDERAKAGLYVAWQNPVMIPGVTVFSLCKASYEALRQAQGKPSEFKSLVDFKKHLEDLAIRVGLTKEHVSRSVNEGFSGGEKKRLELLQLLLLQPKLVVLDEIDSGLDINGVKIVIEIISEMKAVGTSFILITHNKRLLDEVPVDKTWEMRNGTLNIEH